MTKHLPLLLGMQLLESQCFASMQTAPQQTRNQRLPGRVMGGYRRYPPGTGSLNKPERFGDAELSGLGHSPDYVEDLMNLPRTNKTEIPGVSFFELSLRHREPDQPDVVVPFPCPVAFTEVSSAKDKMWGKDFQLIVLCHLNFRKPYTREEIKEAHNPSILRALKDARIKALIEQEQGSWNRLRMFELAIPDKIPRVRLSSRFDPSESFTVGDEDIEVEEAWEMHRQSGQRGYFPRMQFTNGTGWEMIASKSTKRKERKMKVEQGRFVFSEMQDLRTPFRVIVDPKTLPADPNDLNAAQEGVAYQSIFHMKDYTDEFAAYTFVISSVTTSSALPAMQFELTIGDETVASTLMAPRDWQGLTVPRIGTDLKELLRMDDEAT